MSKTPFIGQLIDLASNAAGSDYKLAKELGVSRGNISDWRNGRRPCPAGDVALMADLAGMDPEAWGIRAIVAQYEGTAKGERIARVLGKALLVTGAVIGSSGASAAEAWFYFIRCIKSLSFRPQSA